MKKFHFALYHGLNLVLAIVALVLATLLVVSAYCGYIHPGKGTLYAILAMAFPFILGATATATLLLLVLRRWRIALILVLGIALSWPTVSIVCPLHVSPHHYTATEDSTKFKVLTFNVENFNVLRSGDDRADSAAGQATVRYILEQDADVVLLQEASLAADYNDLQLMKPYMKEIRKKYPYRSHGYHDQVIWSKHPYTNVEDPAIKDGFASPDDPVRSYHFYARAYDVLVPGHTVRFFNVHLQSIGLSTDDKATYMELTNLEKVNDRNELSKVRNTLIAKLGYAFRLHAAQARIIRQVIDQSGENVIVCGDFNDTPASYAYYTMRGRDLKDAYMDCGFGPTYTYHDNRFFFKIDHTLYRGDMIATEARRDKAGSSDHYPLVTTFVWKEIKNSGA